jgi:hypothetical protein
MQEEIKPTINWPDVFVRYEQSGINQKLFCEREGVEFCQFKYHRTHYLKQKAKKSGFARIRMKSADRYDMEVVLPQGVCLKLSHGVPIDYVKRLLQALR